MGWTCTITNISNFSMLFLKELYNFSVPYPVLEVEEGYSGRLLVLSPTPQSLHRTSAPKNTKNPTLSNIMMVFVNFQIVGMFHILEREVLQSEHPATDSDNRLHK